MRKIYFIAFVLLAASSFSCNDQENKLTPPKPDVSLVESNLKMVKGSTTELSFTKGQKIGERIITLVVDNSNAKEVVVLAPVLTPPKHWNLNINPDKPADQEGKIKLTRGQNTLIYNLSGSGNTPTDAQRDDVIKVSFAGKESSIKLNVALVIIKEAKYTGEDLIVGKKIDETNNKIELTLSLPEGIENLDSLSISLPESMDLIQGKGLSAKLKGSSSITLEKGKEAKVTYVLQGTPENDEELVFEITLEKAVQQIKVPKYLDEKIAQFDISFQKEPKPDRSWVKSIDYELRVILKRTDTKKGHVKIKPSSFIKTHCDDQYGIELNIKEGDDLEKVIQEKGSIDLTYKISGRLKKNDAQLSFMINTPNPRILKSFTVSIPTSENELHLATSKNNVDYMRFLINSDFVLDSKITNGEIPLHIAAWNNNGEAVKVLLEAIYKRKKEGDMPGVLSCIREKNERKNTPVHFAASNDELKNGKEPEAMKALMSFFEEKKNENNSIAIDSPEIEQLSTWQNESKRTPLHLAVEDGLTKVVSELKNSKTYLKNYLFTNSKNATDHTKRTPMDWAKLKYEQYEEKDQDKSREFQEIIKLLK